MADRVRVSRAYNSADVNGAETRSLTQTEQSGSAAEGMPGPAAQAFPARADLATLVARFGAALRAERVPVGPEQCERFARAVQLVAPASTGELYRCAQATLVTDPAELPALHRTFQLVFGGLADPATRQPTAADDHELRYPAAGPGHPEPHDRLRAGDDSAGGLGHAEAAASRATGPARQSRYPALAAAAERLGHRDFAELTVAELAELAGLMRRLRLAPPRRRSRRTAVGARGRAVDLRATLRQARRTAGYPLRLRRRRYRRRPRRLVVLCDISGSMAPYARAVLQLLYSATGAAADTEVFTFATRLTRLTPALRRATAAQALARAGRVAPDWSGGTRIGAALKEFTERYGARGMARGAVLVIVSDGWESGDPAGVGRQLARLAKLAYRIVWANPRTARAGYRPLAGGMAAAWPYCHAVVSAHQLAALDDLLAAIGGTAAPAAGDTGGSEVVSSA